ncbi:hypothetical protein MG296_14005 [Flavobacteriaceae bacterium TK19130]|nr:hypothetical protein [Thermobacterium salinum]
MNHLTSFKIVAVIIALTIWVGSKAQHSRTETFSVDDPVTVIVNTNQTDVIFETWNRNKVEVTASIEGENLSDEEKETIFNNWELSIMGNSNQVSVQAKGGNMWHGSRPIAINGNLGDMEFLGPMLEGLVNPIITEMRVPALPEDVLQRMGTINFDYEEFMKDKEAYMEKFEAQMDQKFGKEFEVKMEKWGEEFGKQYEERYGPEFEARMEEWGENFGKQMEAWGENLARQMEAQFGEDGNYSKEVITTPNGQTIIYKGSKSSSNKSSRNGKKTIRIKMPKESKTEINVRHGEIKMADAHNVKATLQYAPFRATSVDGGKTLINAAYAPVIVENWKEGTLYVKYVDQCNIARTGTIHLQANSSDVAIQSLGKETALSGSFGRLTIGGVSNDFQTLDIILENTDAIIDVPDSSFSFYFNGKKSTLAYPKTMQLTPTKMNGRVLVKGFNSSKNSDRLMTINASFSDVRLQ